MSCMHIVRSALPITCCTGRLFFGIHNAQDLSRDTSKSLSPPPYQGINNIVCMYSGNLAGLALAPVLLHTVGWRGLFYVFGLLGAPLLAFWLAVVPSQTPKAESGAQAPPRLSALQMMSKKATWAIIIVNFVNHWGKIAPDSLALHTFKKELK